MGFLLIIKGTDKTVREYSLAQGETSIGRDPANALMLEGRGVSRRHAKITLHGGQLFLNDLGSTYGTRVNGKVTMQRQLADGDTLTLGMYQLHVKEVTDVPKPSSVEVADLTPITLEDEVFEAEDVTLAPPLDSQLDVHQRKTLQMNRNAIHFVLGNPDAKGEAVRVLSKDDSTLMKAVKRLGETADFGVALQQPEPAVETDYSALLLMYRVSELLGAANDLDEFVEPMADLVRESANATTVVVLMRGADGELSARVIRHEGTLQDGEIPVSRAIVDRVVQEKVAVMSNDLNNDDRRHPSNSIMLYNIHAVMAFPLLVGGEVRGVLYLSRSVAKPFTTADGDLGAALASLVASGIQRAELKERVSEEKRQRRALERFHPPVVVDQLFSRGVGAVSFQEHQATALVCDLQGFHGLVGQVEPMKLATVLHEYYEMLYEKIFANGGSLVKLHDGWALALFGTPHSPDRDAVWALESARSLCQEFASVATLWPIPHPLGLRCVLDTGTVVAGVVGSTDRLEYAAIGLPISTASTIAQRAEGTGIWFTERTWAELPPRRYRVDSMHDITEVRVFRLHT